MRTQFSEHCGISTDYRKVGYSGSECESENNMDCSVLTFAFVIFIWAW